VLAEARASDDLTRVAGTVARLSEALVKAVRAQHVLSGAPDDPVQSTLERLLAEVGLESDDWEMEDER
jgi:hypothetical protein